MRHTSRPKLSFTKPQSLKNYSFKHRDSKEIEHSKLDKINTPQEKAKVEKVLGEYKKGKLYSSTGQKVTDRKQAVAIALSEGRKEKDDPPKRGLVYHSRKPSDAAPFHKKDVSMKFTERTAILVPSTKNGDERITKQEYDQRVEETERFMAKEYGGYTAVNAKGGYVSDDGRLIEEPVTEVVAYTDKPTFQKNKGSVRTFLAKKKSDWGQESIGYEDDKNAELYYFKGT